MKDDDIGLKTLKKALDLCSVSFSISLSLSFMRVQQNGVKSANPSHFFPCVFSPSEPSVQRIGSWRWSTPASEREGRTAPVSGKGTLGLLRPEPLSETTASHCTLYVHIMVFSWLSFPRAGQCYLSSILWRAANAFWGYRTLSVTTKHPAMSFPQLQTVNPPFGNWNIHFREIKNNNFLKTITRWRKVQLAKVS